MKLHRLGPVWLIALLAGCGQGQAGSQLGGAIVSPAVTSSIVAALPQILGPGNYTASISGLDTTGHANEVDVTGTNMQIPNGPVIASMAANMQNVNYSISQNQFTQVGPILMVLTLQDTDLTNFLVNQKGIPNSQVTTAPPDQLGVVGTPTVPGLGMASLVIQGHVIPNPSNGAQVNYVLDNVQANGATETDPTILAAISSLYNPLVDLSGIPAHAAITAVSCTTTSISIAATGHFP
ncbi:MAG: LmeA family phospholipid-binding protein [Candidatus Xenobia bacterium]